MFVELKAVNTSAVWRQREHTYETIIFGGSDGCGMIDLAGFDVEFTDPYRHLDATHEGRCELERIADRLGRSAAAAARVMSGDTMVVNDLIRLTVAPNGQPGKREPLTPDYVEEVARVVEGTVLDACEQLPRGRSGIVVVETERSWGSVHDLLRRTEAWFDGPVGRAYPDVAGVLFTYRPWWTTFPCVALAPAWRRGAPRWLVRSRRLRDFAEGLRWADVCAWDWRARGT